MRYRLPLSFISSLKQKCDGFAVETSDRMERESIIPSLQNWNHTLLRCGFRLTATFGLLIGSITLLWQVKVLYNKKVKKKIKVT